jgi:amidophosphoribosyltransferase
MCGLAGVLLHPARRSAEVWREIVKVATANLVSNLERGQEATGVAVIEANGRCQIFKQPIPAPELVKTAGYKQALSAVGSDTVCILGHTRAPTKGSRWRNINNHPLLAGHVVGIHNGVISNDDDIFAHLNLPRAGEVDSEVIFRLLDTMNPLKDSRKYLTLARKRIGLLEGTFTTLSVDLRKPTRLLVLKNREPLCLHYERKSEALFFSSRYLFLRRAFGRSVITEALKNRRGYYYDAQHLPHNGHRPVASFDIP